MLPWLITLVLLIAAALKFSIEIPYIFWNPHQGAIDLRYYFDWTQAWGDGINVYGRADRPEYPPASLVLLFPLTGWLDWAATRVLWGVLSSLGIAVLIVITLRASAAVAWRQQMAVALIVLSNNGVGTALGNGQLILLVLPVVLGAALIARHRAHTVWTDTLVALLVTVASVKPHLALPFVWVILIQPHNLRWRALGLAGTMYLGLTLVGAAWVSAPAWTLLAQAIRHGTMTAAGALDPNLQFLVAKAGVPELMLPLSVMLLTLLGAWVWRHRAIDIWYQLAVCALVARLYVYHRVYDDVLLLLVEVALWQLSRGAPSAPVRQAAWLLLVTHVLILIAPGTVKALPHWAYIAIGLMQGSLWIITLGWLVSLAETSRSSTDSLLWSSPGTIVPSGPPPRA